MIEDLLVAYRDDVSRVPVVSQDFDVVKASERVLEVVDYPIDVQVRGEEAMVFADPRRTRQIVRNLVSNALRYGGDSVLMRIEPVGDRVEISVCDDGIAIDPVEIDRVFRPFETSNTGQHPTSVGLGLPVARRLAQQCGLDAAELSQIVAPHSIVCTYRHESQLKKNRCQSQGESSQKLK